MRRAVEVSLAVPGKRTLHHRGQVTAIDHERHGGDLAALERLATSRAVRTWFGHRIELVERPDGFVEVWQGATATIPRRCIHERAKIRIEWG